MHRIIGAKEARGPMMPVAVPRRPLAIHTVGRNDARPVPECSMRLGFFACLLALVTGPAVAQKQVNVYNWSDYIAEDQLKVFTQQTGIKVNYTTYDSNEILDAKLRAGRSGLRRSRADRLAVSGAPAGGQALPAARQGEAQEPGQSRPQDHGRRWPSTIRATPTPSPGCGARSASAITCPRSASA